MLRYKGVALSAFLLSITSCVSLDERLVGSYDRYSDDVHEKDLDLEIYDRSRGKYILSQQTQRVFDSIDPALLPLVSRETKSDVVILQYSEFLSGIESGTIDETLQGSTPQGVAHQKNAVAMKRAKYELPFPFGPITRAFFDNNVYLIVIPDYKETNMCEFFREKNNIDMQFFECSLPYDAFYTFIVLHENGHALEKFIATLPGEIAADKIAWQMAENITLQDGKPLTFYRQELDDFFRQLNLPNESSSHVVAPFNSGIATYDSGFDLGVRVAPVYRTASDRFYKKTNDDIIALQSDGVLKAALLSFKKTLYVDKSSNFRDDDMVSYVTRYILVKHYLEQADYQTNDPVERAMYDYMRSYTEAVERRMSQEVFDLIERTQLAVDVRAAMTRRNTALQVMEAPYKPTMPHYTFEDEIPVSGVISDSTPLRYIPH